jgi:hypothetical protein
MHLLLLYSLKALQSLVARAPCNGLFPHPNVQCAFVMLLLLSAATAFYIPGVAPAEYTEGELVDVKVRVRRRAC